MRIRHQKLLAALGVALLAIPTSNAVAAEVRVSTTTTDIAHVYSIIGGDRVDVNAMAKGFQDPHYVDAKPSYLVKLRKADLLAYVGLELEVGWLPLLIEGARNRSVVVGAAGNVPMSQGIEILEIPQGQVSRAQGDVHPEGNPHYWLGARNIAAMAATARFSLIDVDPGGEAVYAERADAFVDGWMRAVQGWEERMEPHRGKLVVCHHKQWEYLLDWLGLEVAGYVEVRPGIPPSARHLQGLEKMMKQRGVGVILAANFVDSKPSQRVAENVGANLLVLPASVGGEDAVDSLADLFELIVGSLETAFAEPGP